MPLTAGVELGPYRVVRPIGAGGMGEVYEALDTRLDRRVAIKILTETVMDSSARERIEVEARAIAALNHPHICALHDIGHTDEVAFLVMEYLQGETLAARLVRGRLPLDQAVRYGAEVASALAAAHQRGMVHRDLKPANVMLTKDGAKLLDFGLAKLLAPPRTAERPGGLDDATTGEHTPSEVLVGTLHYMAPEQFQHGPVDMRADIFALGTVLYEMVAGRRPFTGASRALLIGSILDDDPPPLAAPGAPPVPPALEHLIRTCLAKDPADRWQSAHDVARQLAWMARDRSMHGLSSFRVGRRAWPWLVAGAAIVAAGAIAKDWVGRRPVVPADPRPAVRLQFEPSLPARLSPDSVEVKVAPDGQHVAFVAETRGTRHLWLRALSGEAAALLPGTEGASQPFWSPDSRVIGFHADGWLKTIPASGGAVRRLCQARTMAGATWNRDGVILFSQFSALWTVPATGGTPTQAERPLPATADAVLMWPYFLPDGRRYLVRMGRGEPRAQGVYSGTLGARDHRRVLDVPASAVYADGRLLYVRSGTLLAHAFDPVAGTLSGDPATVAGQVMENLGELGGPAISVSDTGVLTYRTRSTYPTTLTWFDRAGGERGTLSAPPGCRNPEVAPDGRRVAVECPDPATQNRDIWIVGTGLRPARLTSDPADESDPVWSPDGRWLVFSSNRGPSRNLYRRLADGAGDDELLFDNPRTKYPNAWTRDGATIALTERGENTSFDVWLLDLKSATASVVLNSVAHEIEPQISPDGRWLMYTSDEYGRWEVYVRPLGQPGGAWLVSPDGGSDARWRGDGGELYYLSPDRRLMAASVARSPSFVASSAVPLFEARSSGPLGLGVRFNYAVSADGQRFLVTTDAPDATRPPATVVLNWTAMLPRQGS